MSEILYVRIGEDLKREVEEQLHDPVTGGLPYGALSHLCRTLLIEWLAKQKKKKR